MLNQTNIKALQEKTDQAGKVVVIPHHNPDGDALGASLALAGLLTELGKSAKVISPCGFPDFLSWMPGADAVIFHDQQSELANQMIHEAELLFLMDFNGLSRLREMEKPVAAANGYKVMIDHHPDPEDIANLVFSHTEVSSTCELLFLVLQQAGWVSRLNKDLAECIYAGIMTDTGSLSYNSGRAETYHVVAELVSLGIDKDMVHHRVFHSNSYSRMQLLGHALSQKLSLLSDVPAAYMALSIKELEAFRFQPGDTEGFVNYPLWIDGVAISALFMERNDMIKASFRSTGNFPVNRFSELYFNGGGHVNAAGGEYHGSLNEAIECFLKKLPEFYAAWKNE
jgi:phosphoesterase RecJ-like protein